MAQNVELLETLTGPHHHRVEWVLRDHDRHTCLGGEAGVDAVEERPPTSQHDAPLHDVGRPLWGRLVERDLDGVDYGGHWLFDGPPDLVRRGDDGFGKPGDEVAAANLSVQLL